MRARTSTMISLSLLVAACGGAPDDPVAADVASVAQGLDRLPLVGETDGVPECAAPGVFGLSSGGTVVCATTGYLEIDGVRGESGREPRLTLELGSLDGLALPPVLLEGTTAQARGKKVRIEAGATGGALHEASSGPVPMLDVAPDCDGVVLDDSTGDAWVCVEGLALLLPAVQKVREAAASVPSFRVLPRGRGTVQLDLHLRGEPGVPPTVVETERGLLVDGLTRAGGHTKADILVE